MLSLGYGLSVIGCGPPDPGVTTTGTSGGTSGVPPTGGAGSDGSGTQGSTAVTTEGNSAGETTAGDESEGTLAGCHPWQQDCPEGEKCTQWAHDGGMSWNATKCVPVTGDGRPGEPCTAEISGVSGLDDCEKGAICWNVDAELHGTCFALCIGTVDALVCADEKASCRVKSMGLLNICVPDCDPFLQDCPGEDLCLPINDDFVCVHDASGDAGAAFDPCEYANVCDPGLLCAGPDSAIECDPRASGCCTPMCRLDDADFVCPGVGQECVSLYEEGMAPPKFANVGYCTITE